MRVFLASRQRGEYAARMVEWRITEPLQDYAEALAWQEARVAAIRAGEARECVWLLEHPPLLTAGTSAKASDLLEPDRFPVYEAGRGGEYTYHGPGQRVAYAMMDLTARGRDVRAYVHRLEEWIIRALAEFGVKGERRAVGQRRFFGSSAPKKRRCPTGRLAKTRSRPSACGFAAGSLFTA